MGWTPSEIAQAYLVNKSSVHRAIDAVRHAQSWGDRTAKQRHADLLSEIYDGARLTIRESWRIYLQQLKEKPASAFPFLRAVQSGLLVLSRLAPDQEALYFEEMLAKVREDQQRIEEAIEERKQSNKVLPVRTGS
jgi:HSP90 family molecular chaperone